LSKADVSPGSPSVLMITGEYPPALGGVGDYTELLCSHLSSLGARVSVLTRAGLDDRVASAGTDRVPVLRTVRSWGPGSWGQIASAVAGCHAQVVHIQYQAAAYAMNPAINTLPAYLRARLPRVRIVTTFHDLRVPYLFPKAGPLRGEAVRALDLLSHATVVTNQSDLVGLQGAGRRGPTGYRRRWLIPLGSNVENAPPPGYDRTEWRRQIGADKRTLVAAYFGFLNESKGVDLLVEAVALLMERGISVKLLMVGGETGVSDPTNQVYAERVRQAIASRQIDRNIHWTGFASPQQVSAYLLSSDLCILPYRDGVSLRRGSLMAALVHGLAVVTTAPQVAEPLLRNGENVTMVRRNDPVAIADMAEYLWRDEPRRQRLSAGAMALAAGFQWPDIAARHMELYAAVLASGRGRRSHSAVPLPRMNEDLP